MGQPIFISLAEAITTLAFGVRGSDEAFDISQREDDLPEVYAEAQRLRDAKLKDAADKILNAALAGSLELFGHVGAGEHPQKIHLQALPNLRFFDEVDAADAAVDIVFKDEIINHRSTVVVDTTDGILEAHVQKAKSYDISKIDSLVPKKATPGWIGIVVEQEAFRSWYLRDERVDPKAETNSLKVDAKAFEAEDRIVVRSETDRGAKPFLGKRGPKPKYDWKKLHKIAFQILDAQGTPTRIDEDLPNQASLIRQVLDKANIEPVPGDSTMRIHAAQWIREFEETRRQIASN